MWLNQFTANDENVIVTRFLAPDEEMEPTSTQSFRYGGRIHYNADEVAVRADLQHHVFVHLEGDVS